MSLAKPTDPLTHSFPGEGAGVGLAGASASAAPADSGAVTGAGMDVDVNSDSSDSDSDLDLFGEMTEEEKKAQEEKKAVIAKAKARAAEKEKKCKSLIVMDVKPWDDETDMAKMEAEIRAIEKDGLLWGSSKLVTFAFGMKKLQITAVIEDTKIPSFDEIIENHILLLDDEEEVQSENVQSVDILSFNKL